MLSKSRMLILNVDTKVVHPRKPGVTASPGFFSGGKVIPSAWAVIDNDKEPTTTTEEPTTTGEPLAPCECPCEMWPPEDEPCGGLEAEYTFEYLHGFAQYDGPTCSGDFLYGVGWRVFMCILTAGGGEVPYFVDPGVFEDSCTWGGPAMLQVNLEDPQAPEWVDAYEVYVLVSLAQPTGQLPCRWRVSVFGPESVDWQGYKTTGLTPAGQYIENEAYPTCTISNPGDPIDEQVSIYNYGSATIS